MLLFIGISTVYRYTWVQFQQLLDKQVDTGSDGTQCYSTFSIYQPLV